MTNYWIQVFNQQSTDQACGEGLMQSLLDANFQTLCRQYSLDSGLIGPALANLALIYSPKGGAPYFLLKYRPENEPPLVIYRWETDGSAGARWLREAQSQAGQGRVGDWLAQTREIIAVSLIPVQLEDMGLLLAYEVARWAGFSGNGLVHGLDGTWYRLNRHRAFIPVSDTDLD